jgi:tetratricopeptide (TPR) repeat protein
MSRGTKVVGARAPIIWLLIAIAVIVVAALAVGGLVIYPQIMEKREEHARLDEAERHYQAGLAFESAEEWEAAKGEYMQVISIDAGYKDTQARMAEVNGKLAEGMATSTAMAIAQAEQAQATAQAEATAQAQSAAEAQAAAQTATGQVLEAHYQRALGFINLEKWVEAQAELQSIFDVDPNYKDVQAQLALVNAEVAKLTPTATPTPLATPIPPIITLRPKSATSFQNEGTLYTDDTALVQEKDGYWAPSLTGSVTQDYLATGNGAEFFDALSLQFDIGERSYQDFHAVLRRFVQHGAYGELPHGDSRWNHYLALPGKQNPDYQDSVPFNVPNVKTIDYSTGKWIEIELSPQFWSEGKVWVTLRMWNIRVDAVELVLTPK